MAKTKSRGRRLAAKEREIIDDEEINNSNNLEFNSESQKKTVFFGLVDSNELDYFKQAESTLNVNMFDSDEERQGFIGSVLEEAKGKELKLVTNQICSKLMERLILGANNRQLKELFQLFGGHFVDLACQKYSSHVLETLFVRSAGVIERELILGGEETNDNNEDVAEGEEEETDSFIPMETLFNKMLNEFKPIVKTMIDDQYSSHVLRLLILIMSGKPMPSSTMAHSTLRSKKSKIARKMIDIKDNEDFLRAFQTPASFKPQLRDYCNAIGIDENMRHMRELASQKVASPVLQLLVQVEGIIDKERTIWHLLFLKVTDPKDPQEEAFMEFLLSDSVGSHFLESIIKNDGVRMKYIERLYQLYIKDRILKLTGRSTTAIYAIQALLFKLKPVEVEYILDIIIPEFSNLVSVSENHNIDFGKAIIDASISRFNYRKDDIVSQLFKKFAPNYNEDDGDNTSTEFLENTLQLTGSTLGNTKDDWPTAEERRRALFVEKLMQYDYKFVICSWYNFMALPSETLEQMCFHGVFSRVIEELFKVLPDEEKPVAVLRKRVLNLFQGKMVKLACNAYGSHLVDKLWDFTIFLPMYKDRIAMELYGESKKVKESNYGRLVWKNWGMELFIRKKYEWKALIKQQEAEFHVEHTQEEQQQDEGAPTKKRPIDIKMEQLAKERELQEKRRLQEENGDDDGSNGAKRQKIRGRNR